MVSKKSKQGNQTNPTFVVGRVYQHSHIEQEDGCDAERVADGFARYIGPSSAHPGEHIMESADGDLNYVPTDMIDAV